MKKLLKIILVIVLVFVVFVGGAAVGLSSYPHLTTPNGVAKPLTQDPILLADAQQLGIDTSNVNLSFADQLSASDVSPSDVVVGSFTAPNNIKVKSGQEKSQELNTVAYEFMHYFWSQLPVTSQSQLTTTLNDFYNQDSEFQRITAGYVGSDAVLADERNSTACTLVPPYVLTDDFNAYCNQFIPNRAILFE